MSTDLNIHLSPEAFTALQQVSRAAGRTPSEEAAALLEQFYRPLESNTTHTQLHSKTTTGRRIEDFFGTIDLGHPICSDNMQIDADLAREYGRGLHGE